MYEFHIHVYCVGKKLMLEKMSKMLVKQSSKAFIIPIYFPQRIALIIGLLAFLFYGSVSQGLGTTKFANLIG